MLILSYGRGRWSEKKKKTWRFERFPQGVLPPGRMRISILKYCILVALIGVVLPMGSLDRVPLFYHYSIRAYIILVFACLNYSKCLRVPPSPPPPHPQVGVNLFWSEWITGLLIGELRYCLNMVTRQEQFTSTNAFHSTNLIFFFIFPCIHRSWAPLYDEGLNGVNR